MDVSTPDAINESFHAELNNANEKLVGLVNCAIGFRNTANYPKIFDNLAYWGEIYDGKNYFLGCLSCKPGYKGDID